MPEPVAFLQVGPDAFACAEGGLHPIESPIAAGVSLLAPRFSLDDRHPWWRLASGGPALPLLSRKEWSERFPGSGTGLEGLEWSAPDEPRFRMGFDSLQPLLAAGVLRKGVPITVARAPLSPERAACAFTRLLARVADLPNHSVAYGLFLPEGDEGEGPEFVIGATPEMLFEVEADGSLKTTAVAGTRRVEPGSAAALEASAKDRVEHDAVVEDLVSQIGRWGEPRRGPTQVHRFGDLDHLVTPLAVAPACLPGFADLVRALHPTPALGVHPRGPAGSNWLASLDPAGSRRRFGAPFGIRWPDGSGRAVVAIRNVQYCRGHLEIWAGCGVVPESSYESEWQEILDKVHAVRAMWRL